jgi:hypothetical protein
MNCAEPARKSNDGGRMKLRATLVSLSDNIEELVVLDFCSYVIACFANFCNMNISVGEIYSVELTPYFSDAVDISVVSDGTLEELVSIDNGFGCLAIGTIDSGSISVGTVVFSASELDEFQYLNGKKVRDGLNKPRQLC